MRFPSQQGTFEIEETRLRLPQGRSVQLFTSSPSPQSTRSLRVGMEEALES